jgi:hypothetical protein
MAYGTRRQGWAVARSGAFGLFCLFVLGLAACLGQVNYEFDDDDAGGNVVGADGGSQDGQSSNTDGSADGSSSGDTGSNQEAGPTDVAIGGNVNGLTAGSLVLQNNGTDDLTVTNNGPFTFPKKLAKGGAYAVTVKTPPSGLICTVSQGTGAAQADVSNVVVSCDTPGYIIGGVTNGLTGSLTVQLNGGNDLVINDNGAWSFPSKVNNGTSYSVTVTQQPPGQTCNVTNGLGFVAGANVTNVAIACAANHTIGGSISNLLGTGLVLQNNLGDDLVVPANATTFTFATAIREGNAYSVSVKTQPTGPVQTCTVGNGTGSGVVGTANVTSVTVNCVTPGPNDYIIGGVVSGLSGTLSVQLNGGTPLALNGNGPWSFSNKLLDGSSYNVTISSQPAGQTCNVTNGVGFVAGGNITNIAISCAPNHTIGGTASNLVGTGLVLQNNLGNDLAVPAGATTFTFPTGIREGNAYSVTVKAQPSNPSQTCTITNGSGLVGSSDVTTVGVNCTTNTYTVSAAVTGNTSAVTLLLNGANGISPASSGTYTFGAQVASGAVYNVTVSVQPSTPRNGQTAGTRQRCLVSNPGGTVVSSNVVVNVTCLTSLFEDFDDPVDLIPPGWTVATPIGTPANDAWAAYELGTPGPQSFPYYFFAKGVNHQVLTTITTPPVAIVNTNARLTFWHHFKTLAGDGGYLAIKIGAAAFVDVLSAGCTFVDVGSGVRGYTGTITDTTNPIYAAPSGRSAWTGNISPDAYAAVGLDLPASAAGQNVQFQWVWGSNSSQASSGWIIDTVQLDR